MGLFSTTKIKNKDIIDILNTVSNNISNQCISKNFGNIYLSASGDINLEDCNVIYSGYTDVNCNTNNNIQTSIQNEVKTQIQNLIDKKTKGITFSAGDKNEIKNTVDTYISSIISNNIYNNCQNTSVNTITIEAGGNINCDDSTIKNTGSLSVDCMFDNELTNQLVNDLVQDLNNTMKITEEGPVAAAVDGLTDIVDDLLGLGAIGVILILGFLLFVVIIAALIIFGGLGGSLIFLKELF